MNDDAPPLNVPGFPMVAPGGAGSRSGYQYSPALGDLIAELWTESDSGGLWELHHAMPERIPPPAIVHAWKKQYPAFGLVMKAAEAVRAERLIEQTIVIADGEPDVRRAALRIATRQHYAGQLDRARFGKGDAAGHAPQLGSDAQPVALTVSDDALASIALGGAGVAAGGAGDGAGG